MAERGEERGVVRLNWLRGVALRGVEKLLEERAPKDLPPPNRRASASSGQAVRRAKPNTATTAKSMENGFLSIMITLKKIESASSL